MSTKPTHTQERTDSDDPPDGTARPVTGPHDGYDRHGRLDYRYWRCERCGLESADPRLRRGCFRCGAGRRAGTRTGDRTDSADRTDQDESQRRGADDAE